MRGLIEYWTRVYDARFYWSTLAKIDLKNKFRRSKLGILWVCVNPLCLTIIMAVVFSVAFHQELSSYAPYILSGILCWNVFIDSLIAGSSSILGSGAFIKQFNHPIIIYPLKSTIAEIVSFTISMLALAIWELFVNPLNVLIGIVFLIPAIVVYFCFGWAATIISSYAGAKYRDYPQLAGLILQALWYVSPVFMQESMFESNEMLYKFFLANPITHMLALVRQPFLYGKSPSLTNYLVSIGFVAVVVFLAYLIDHKNSKDVIFYI